MSENIELNVDLSHLEEDSEDYEHHVDSNMALTVPQMPQMPLIFIFLIYFGGGGLWRGPSCSDGHVSDLAGIPLCAKC